MDNRRQDKRLHLPDLQIKVKKSGLGEGDKYTQCTPVDVSWNGLAFSSDSLELDLLQKIDVQLSVGHKNLEGSAVICHIEKKSLGVSYGVLYIDIKPSLEETFKLEGLSSTLVENLAISMADNAVIGSGSNETDVLMRKAQIILFDATQGFKLRIGSLIDDTIDSGGKVYKLNGLFEFSPSTLSVTIPLMGADGKTLEKKTISPVFSTSKQKVVFETGDGEQYDSILDILQDLSDTFQWVLSDRT